MKLGDVVDRLMRHYDEDQGAFAKRVGATGQSMVSRMRKGDDWEQHWQILLRVLDAASQLGINCYEDIDLPPLTAQGMLVYLRTQLERNLNEGLYRPKQEIITILERAVERTQEKAANVSDVDQAGGSAPLQNRSRRVPQGASRGRDITSDDKSPEDAGHNRKNKSNRDKTQR